MAEKKKPGRTVNIAPPPPPPDQAAKRKPVGVPRDYRAVTEERYRPAPGKAGPFLPGGPVEPRYFEEHVNLPAAFSPEKIARLQKELATAGLIGPKTKFRLGLFDETTRNAYKKLLEYANRAGLDERAAIRQYAMAELVDPSGTEEGRAPLRIKKTNPADLIAIADVAARSTLGRKLRPDEASRLAAAFQVQEVAEQTQFYNQGETGGTTVSAPRADVFMAERIRKEYGVEAGAHDLAGQFGEFGELLRQVGG